MTLPTNVGSGRIVGRFVVGIIDSPNDLDDEPELIPAQGTITFTPNIKYIPNSTTEIPMTIMQAPITGVLDSEGYLCTPDNSNTVGGLTRGVKLFATDVGQVTGWTYTVKYSFTPVGTIVPSIPEHPLTVPDQSTRDLSKIAPTPYAPVIGIPQIEATALRVEQYAKELGEAISKNITGEIVGDYDHMVSTDWKVSTDDYVDDTVSESVGSTPILIGYSALLPRILDGKIHLSLIPDLPTYAKLDGSTPFDLIRLGQSAMLKEVRGARGHRIQFKSNQPGNQEARPYFEVDASDEDWNGDVTAGFQSHVTGDGSTPNSGERVYWFLEAHGLEHTANANPDFEGWYSMGVSNRAELTARGRGRAFILDAGNRPGMAMHFYKPYIELQPNTAFTLDDRARPAWGDGAGPNHVARTAGTLIGGHYINFRREGMVGARFETLNNSPATSPEYMMLRARGTVEAPLPVQAGDRLSTTKSGTVYNVSTDYVHVPGAGSDPRNQPVITQQDLAVATENFVEGVAQGTRKEIQVTPKGSTSLVTGLQIDEAPTAGDTSILIRTNKDGTTTQTRVTIGDPDSGGPGFRALVIPN